MAAVSQTHVILCADIDKTGDFFHNTFKYDEVVKDIQQPFPHASISITDEVQLILVIKLQPPIKLLVLHHLLVVYLLVERLHLV